MDFSFEPLLKAVDVVLIIAIIGITEAVKRSMPEIYWRWTPLIPLGLGILGGLFVSPAGSGWRVVAKAALLYAGAAAIGYELLRTTIFKSGAKTENKLLILPLILALALSGCASLSRQYLYSPSPFERAVARAAAVPGADGKVSKANIVLADLDVVEFADAVETAWRRRDQLARGVDIGGDVAEAGLGVVPVIMTALNFAWPVGPIISAVNALVSRILGAINPTARIEAYSDGIGMLSEAKATYFKAASNDGHVASDKLTDAGHTLFTKTNYAIQVVEKTIGGRVPNVSEMQGAGAR